MSRASLVSLTPAMLATAFLFLTLPAAGQQVDAAVNWTAKVNNAGVGYLMHATEYVRYPLTGSAPEGGTRQTQQGWNLPASWGGEMDAAVNWGNGVAYLFRGTEYVRYKLDANAPDGGPRDTQSNWNFPPSWGGRVDAAVNWGNGKAYFFNGIEYVRYPLNGSRPDSGPTSTQSGWNLPSHWAGKVDSAINWGNGVAYLFRGNEYVRYPLSASRPDGAAKVTQPNWKLPTSWLADGAYLRPVGDSRCLARTTGGFTLAACSVATQAEFRSPGYIDFSGECVSVRPKDAQHTNPWHSGTTLMALPCGGDQVPKSHQGWLYDPNTQLIRATSAPSGTSKCLSIAGAHSGSLRAVVLDCGDGNVTQWTMARP